MLDIRVNGESLDLSKGEVVALTFALANIGKLDTREGTTSNTFKVPLTNANRARLGFPDQLNVTGQEVTPYQKVPCEVYQDQLLLTKGYLKIEEVFQNEKEVDITIFSDNADWFPLIKDVSLSDLNLDEYDHIYSDEDIVSNIDNTTGFFYPIINYGLFTNGLREYYGANVNEFYPAVYCHTIFKKIFEHIGFKIEGTLLSIPLFKKSFIPWSKEDTTIRVGAGPTLSNFIETGLGYLCWYGFTGREYTGSLLSYTPDRLVQMNKTHGFVAKNTVSQVIGTSTTPTKVRFDGIVNSSILSNLDGNWADSRYTAKRPVRMFFEGQITQPSVPSNQTNIIVRKNGVDYVQAISPTGFVVPFSADVFLNTGDYVEIFAFTTSGTTIDPTYLNQDICALHGEIINVVQTSTYALTTDGLNYNFNEITPPVGITPNLPDMSAVDFVKTIFAQYGVIFKTNLFTKTITFDTFRDLINRKSEAVDWSGKIDLSQSHSINFSELISDYGKKNFFRYTKDDSDPYARRLDGNWPSGTSFGEGFISIRNSFLPSTADFFESVFAPTVNTYCFSGVIYVPNIIRYNTEGISFERQDGTVSVTTGSKDVVGVGTTFTNLEEGMLIRIDGIVRRIISVTNNTNLIVDYSYSTNQSGIPFDTYQLESEATEPRMLINLGMMTTPSFTIGSETVTQIPLTFFIRDNIDGSGFDNFKQTLAFDVPNIYPGVQTLKTLFYNDLTNILNSPKFIRAALRLNQLDIHNLDILKPVYLDFYKSYFYINKIDEYRPDNSSTIVELVKI